MPSTANARTDARTRDGVSRCLNQWLLHRDRQQACEITGLCKLMLDA